MSENTYVTAAARSIQEGNPDKAREILLSYVEQNPDDVQAWFLLSGTLTEPYQMVQCLRHTLALDPQHEGAQTALNTLEQQTGQAPLQVMQVGSNSAAMGRPCPFCSNDFQMAEEVVACPACSTSHHGSCWGENGYRCATRLCQGYSLREERAHPLPIQPAASDSVVTDPQVIVIRKEDIGQAVKITRKEQEQRFQRRLLLLKLLEEEGEVAPEVGAGLPSVDELLDQIQRDRQPAQADRAVPMPPSSEPEPPKATEDETTPTKASPLPPPTGAYQHTPVVTGVIPVMPQPTEPARPEGAHCQQCGYAFQNPKARFCRQCGAQRVDR